MNLARRWPHAQARAAQLPTTAKVSLIYDEFRSRLATSGAVDYDKPKNLLVTRNEEKIRHKLTWPTRDM